MTKPRGRPKCSAQWDGTKWVLDEDAEERAAIKLLENRKRCRERRRETRKALEERRPQLFKKKDTQTTLSPLIDPGKSQ